MGDTQILFRWFEKNVYILNVTGAGTNMFTKVDPDKYYGQYKDIIKMLMIIGPYDKTRKVFSYTIGTGEIRTLV